jgi:hypothetical protein
MTAAPMTGSPDVSLTVPLRLWAEAAAPLRHKIAMISAILWIRCFMVVLSYYDWFFCIPIPKLPRRALMRKRLPLGYSEKVDCKKSTCCKTTC